MSIPGLTSTELKTVVAPSPVVGQEQETVGFFGIEGVEQITLPAAATDAATTQALANAIRDALIAYGLAK